MALTKAEMAERLFIEVGLNKREAKEFVDAYFEVVREALENGEQVKLSGFGNFDLRLKNQRPGRNPKTGEEIPISARRVVTFRPGQKLKLRVEGYAGSGEYHRAAGYPGQTLLHHRRSGRVVRCETPRAALLGAGVSCPEPGQAPRQPPLLPAP
jgi:integration host factor subunit alpha